MKSEEITPLSFSADRLPENWRVIKDPENPECNLVFPEWFLEKIKAGSWISASDFSRYRSECQDLEISFHLGEKKP